MRPTFAIAIGAMGLLYGLVAPFVEDPVPRYGFLAVLLIAVLLFGWFTRPRGEDNTTIREIHFREDPN